MIKIEFENTSNRFTQTGSSVCHDTIKISFGEVVFHFHWYVWQGRASFIHFFWTTVLSTFLSRFFYDDLLLKISWSSGWLKRYSSTTSFIGPESRLLTPETDRRQANVMLHNWCTNWSTSTNWGAVLLSFIADTKVFCRHQEASQEAFKSYWLCYVRFLFILETFKLKG